MKHLLFIGLLLLANLAFGQLEVQDLTCEYMINPSVVDEPNPRLSWINIAKAGVRNQVQNAYQIRVAQLLPCFKNLICGIQAR